MFSMIPNQLTTAATAYWINQFELGGAFTAKALDSTKLLADLNMRTLHDATERSSAALQQALPADQQQVQLATDRARAYASQVADLAFAMRTEYAHLLQGNLAASNTLVNACLDNLTKNVPDGAGNVVELLRATLGSVNDGCNQFIVTSEQSAQAVAATFDAGDQAFAPSHSKPAKRPTAH